MQSVIQQGYQYNAGLPVVYNSMANPMYGGVTVPAVNAPYQTQYYYPGSYYLMPQVPFVPGSIYPSAQAQNNSPAALPVKTEKAQEKPLENNTKEIDPKQEQAKPNEAMPKSVDKKQEQNPETKEDKPQIPETKSSPVTNEYIMTLENFLNSPDKSIRKQGLTKVIEKAKQQTNDGQQPGADVDQWIKNLMNKALQDPDPGIRTLAFGLFNYTNGDQLTLSILNKYMSSSSSFGTDADNARTTLLRMSEKGVSINNVNQAQPELNNRSTK
jgi:hypothetical protein